MVFSGIKSVTMEVTPFLYKSLVALVKGVLENKVYPADILFQRFYKEKKLNSNNRRMLASLFFDLLRKYWLCFYYAKKAAQAENIAENIVDAFLRLPESPGDAPLSAQMNMSEDTWRSFEKSLGAVAVREAKEMQQEAFVDIRVNTFAGFTKSYVARSLCADGLFIDELPYGDGLRLQTRVDFSKNALYKCGAFEVQDFGSQIVAELCCFERWASVLDYCAGSGGKSLAILNKTPKFSKLVLTDIDPHRLTSAKSRFAKIHDCARKNRFFEEKIEKNVFFCDFSDIEKEGANFDLVIVDAPCSGIGTLKRNPWLTVHMGPSTDYTIIQREILRKAVRLVKKGGHAVYITCSLMREENEDVIEDFLKNNTDFSAIDMAQCWSQCFGCDIPRRLGLLEMGRPFLRLLPSVYKTDGFFMGIIKRTVL
jgi:16S rRNA (cytosine967-C5)-methyltransferase